MSGNVEIRISIQIETEGEYDTGLTVEQWNALTDEERSMLYLKLWSEVAGDGDNGGAMVITDGAEGI